MSDAGADRTRGKAVQESAEADGADARRAIARRDFEQVIRRAAELSLSDTDPDDNLSEEEVFRIATELGLPAHHVRQALFELPELRVKPRWYDGWFGPAVFSISRVVPAHKDPVLRRLEDYLVTREYLQIVRRRSDTIAFVPADDTISSLARALARPGRRHIISRASRMMVGVHGVPEDAAHVRFDIDLSEARKDAVRSGALIGGSLGLATGAVAAVLTGPIAPDVLGIVPQIIVFGGAMAGTMAAGLRIAAGRFRERVFSAKMELTGLLDRLEHGGRLDPPPAPWRRSLHRLFGERP
ncbi:MAG TPA: hypothetical protein VFZ24_18395 [Longimicrobiales bacterium]